MGNVSERIEQESPLSQLISERRKELGLSMKQVADAVGVSEATISRYESGDIKNMRRDRIDKYAKILQVDLRDLIEADGEDSTDRVIGERLKEARINKGLTQSELAEKITGQSKAQICAYEKGRRDIPRKSLLIFAKVLDVSPSYLSGFDVSDDYCKNKPVLCLTDLRLEKDLSMRQIAAELGIPYMTYVNYEKGICEPGLEMLGRLADYFGVTVDRLMGREKADDTMTDTRTHTDFESYDKWANAEKLYELDEKMKRLTERVERLEADGRNDGLTVNTASYWEKFLREE